MSRMNEMIERHRFLAFIADDLTSEVPNFIKVILDVLWSFSHIRTIVIDLAQESHICILVNAAVRPFSA